MDMHQEEAEFALYIGNLLFKSADNQPLTEKEMQDLELWRNSSPLHQEIFQDAKDYPAPAEELRLLNRQYDPDQAVSDLFHTLGLDHTADRVTGHGKRRLVYRLTAAAAIVLLIASAWMFTQRRGRALSEATVSDPVRNDVAPAGNRAILTLSDGSRIELDSAKNGALTRQGGVNVMNKNGEVSYQDAGSPAAVVYNTMSTLRGGKYQLTLPDGTRIWLNAESSVRFPSAFTGQRREIELSGEAYFEVAQAVGKDGHDRVPFIVKINSSKGNGAEVQVLGTHFNIMAYNNEHALETTLLEGSVLFNKGTENILLKPGQQGRWSEDEHMKFDGNADIESIVAWKNGLQAFHEADIPSIMRHVERWYDVKVDYQGAQPDGLTFSGEVPGDVNLSQLLKVFETSALHFQIDGAGHKVTVVYHGK